MANAQPCPADEIPKSASLSPAAQIVGPPSQSKQLLIKQFLTLIGLQKQLDSGSFLDRYAMPDGPLWKLQSGEGLQETLGDGFKVRSQALRAAYAKRKSIYQKAYEDHLNWEFTEAELKKIVGFLKKPLGQHFLDGRWRMEAYTQTNTEDIEVEIIDEAAKTLKK